MTRRIAVMGTGDDQVDRTDLPAPIGQLPHADDKAVLEAVHGAVFPDSPEARQITIEAYIAAGRRLSKQGYDALYINTMGDYGLEPLRRELDIPVAGSGEAAIRAAVSLGRPFSIVTIWPPKMRFIYDYVLHDSTADGLCQCIFFLSGNDELGTMGKGNDFYSNMRSCDISALRQVRETVHQAIKNGARSVILGCTCMSHLGPILRADDLPVIEPMATGYLYCRFLCDASR